MSYKSLDSRRYSNASTASTSDDDPLMRDCIGLRQRLLETEKTLQNLTLSSTTPRISPNTSRILTSDVDKSMLSDKAPILTLADLTPVSSIESSRTKESFQTNRLYSSLGELERVEPPQLQNEIQTVSLTQCNHHTDLSIFRRKILSLREENSKLFLQNNKLMTELEKTSFRLQECQAELQEMNIFVKENKELKDINIGTMQGIEEQIKKKNQIIKQLEKLVKDLRDRLNQEDKEKEEHEKLHQKYQNQMEKYEEMYQAMKLKNAYQTSSQRFPLLQLTCCIPRDQIMLLRRYDRWT